MNGGPVRDNPVVVLNVKLLGCSRPYKVCNYEHKSRGQVSLNGTYSCRDEMNFNGIDIVSRTMSVLLLVLHLCCETVTCEMTFLCL